METANLEELPEEVQLVINEVVESAQNIFKDNLTSVVLYGSAAEGALRATSDVNVIFVLKSFQQQDADNFRDTLRTAHAAIQLNGMFLLESEINLATEIFTVKFADVINRHTILYGINPFENVELDASTLLHNLKQTTLNLQLRLRETYVLKSLREEKLILAIADTIGPLRSIASCILLLQERPAPSPKLALEQLVNETQNKVLIRTLETMRSARETGLLGPGESKKIFMDVLGIIQFLREHISLLEGAN